MRQVRTLPDHLGRHLWFQWCDRHHCLDLILQQPNPLKFGGSVEGVRSHRSPPDDKAILDDIQHDAIRSGGVQRQWSPGRNENLALPEVSEKADRVRQFVVCLEERGHLIVVPFPLLRWCVIPRAWYQCREVVRQREELVLKGMLGPVVRR
jgi:hypothetical protein